MDEAYRGKGLADRLIHCVLEHPDLPEVLQFNLQCKEEMMAFYERFGFTHRLGDLFYMRRTASRQR